MSGHLVGYRWPALAQQAFMNGTCRAGQSISEWCSLSARDQCCGALCPNPPITGPGTVIAFTVGTLMNLLVTFLWKSEAAYNILWQIFSTDGACVALLFRLLLTHNRLTQFHAAFVPLAVMSCLPVTVAACTVEIEYMHNLDYNAYVSLWGNYYDALMERYRDEQEKEKGEQHEKKAEEPADLRSHFRKPFTKDERLAFDRLMKEATLPGGFARRPYLPWIVLAVLGLHLVGWAFLLILSVSVGPTNAFQLNCSGELPVAYWSRVASLVAFAHWIVTFLMWFLFLLSMKGWRAKKNEKKPLPAEAEQGTTPDGSNEPKKPEKPERPKNPKRPREYYKRDPLQIIAFCTTSRRFMKAVKPVKQGWSRQREIIRWSLSFFFYFAWFSSYVTLYILALKKLVMVGDNPFDYGQVAACVGTLGGAITVVRCVVNESAYFRARHHTASTNNFIAKVGRSIFDNEVFLADSTVPGNQEDPLAAQSTEGSSQTGSTAVRDVRPPSSSSVGRRVSSTRRSQSSSASHRQRAQFDEPSSPVRGRSARASYRGSLDDETRAHAEAALRYLARFPGEHRSLGRSRSSGGNRSSTVSSERRQTAPLLGRRS